jgi:hypothetical protein
MCLLLGRKSHFVVPGLKDTSLEDEIEEKLAVHPGGGLVLCQSYKYIIASNLSKRFHYCLMNSWICSISISV